MRYLLMLSAAAILGVTAMFSATPDVSFAAFHCMRIHAVKYGFAANPNVQYVELRMDLGGQPLVSTHTIEFRDSGGMLKATFTFPSDVSNQATGESILIATPEFNAYASGGSADFTFSVANTVGSNGGDPLHPVQGTDGKVIFAPPTFACSTALMPVDSVAYGTAAADRGGSPAVALPAATDNRALRLSSLNTTPGNNSTEYSLQAVSATAFTVAIGNLATDFTTPRNNMREVIKLSAPAAATNPVGGVAEVPDVQRSAPAVSSADDGGRGVIWYALPVGAALLFTAMCGGWVWRRRALGR